MIVYLKYEEVKNILNYWTERGRGELLFAALFSLQYQLGARISEVLPLRRGEILNADGTVKDVISRLKLKARKKARMEVQTSSALDDYIINWADYQRSNFARIREGDFFFSSGSKVEPISRNYAYKKYRIAGERCGIGDKVGTHTARRSFGLYIRDMIVQAGESETYANRQVQELFGHKSIETTMRYLKVDETDSKRWLSVFNESIKS